MNKPSAFSMTTKLTFWTLLFHDVTKIIFIKLNWYYMIKTWDPQTCKFQVMLTVSPGTMFLTNSYEN